MKEEIIYRYYLTCQLINGFFSSFYSSKKFSIFLKHKNL